MAADRPVVPASVFKVLVALEFYARAAEGEIDPAKQIDLRPAIVTPGPVGLSNFQDAARLSLRDLARMMLTLSDNAATDLLIARVGLDAINARAVMHSCIGKSLRIAAGQVSAPITPALVLMCFA